MKHYRIAAVLAVGAICGFLLWEMAARFRDPIRPRAQPAATVETDFSAYPKPPLTIPRLYAVPDATSADYILFNPAGSARVVEQDGHFVLTGSDTGDKGEIAIAYTSRRSIADVSFATYTGTAPATISFHEGGDFGVIARCTVQVTPGMKGKTVTCTADRGQTIQGVSWQGDQLVIEKVTHRNVGE